MSTNTGSTAVDTAKSAVDAVRKAPRSFLDRLVNFTLDYNILNFTVGTAMGIAVTDFVSSLTDDLISPFVLSALGPSWREHVTTIGSVQLRTGDFLTSVVRVGTIVLILVILLSTLFRFDVAAQEAQREQEKAERERQRQWQQQVLQQLQQLNQPLGGRAAPR